MFEWWCVILGALLIGFVAYNVGYNDGFRRGFEVNMDMFMYGETEDDGTIVWRPEKSEKSEEDEEDEVVTNA